MTDHFKSIARNIFPPLREPLTVWTILPIALFLLVYAITMISLDITRTIAFSRPAAFALMLFAVWVWWMAICGYSGMSVLRRNISLMIRLSLVGLLVMLLAEPRAVRISDTLSVIFAVDLSDSISDESSEQAIGYAVDIGTTKPEEDEAALLVFAKDAAVELPPRKSFPYEAINSRVDRGATNIEQSLSLSAAMLPEENQKRIVLLSDGQETEGDLTTLLDELVSRDITVDVLPIEYSYDSEVWLERLDLPHGVKLGESYDASIILSSKKAGKGTLVLEENGEKIAEEEVEFNQGKNAYTIPIQLRQPGYYEYTARIETEDGVDHLKQNNTVINYLFIEGEGTVLLVTSPDGDPQDWADLQRAIQESDRIVSVISSYEFPVETMSLLQYDAVVFVNVAANEFDPLQKQAMHDAVKNLGVGFAMIGGENSFGPGGYHRTVIEDALPVTMDVKNKKVLPKGALAIILHTCEFAAGNTWGKDITKQAIQVLSAQDEAGVLVYGQTGEKWLFELTPTSEYPMMVQKINGAMIGDMPSFATTMRLGLNGLKKSDASAKHMIIISDGDPQPPSPKMIQEFVENKISISMVAVFPHGGQDISKMRQIAQSTGGRYYFPGNPNELPGIFMKEAQTLQRAMIQNKTVLPEAAFPSPILKGIDSIHPLHGYVLASVRDEAESVLQVINEGEKGVDVDPVLATWQYGLGKTAAFTSDLSLNWGKDWVNWEQYQAFVQQFIVHISRVSRTSDLSMRTYVEGNIGTIVVEDASPQQDFMEIQAKVGGPDGRSETVALKQVGPRTYQANLPLWGKGRYSILAAGVAGEREEQATGAFIVPYSNEYLKFDSNKILLRQIAEKTGGQELTPEDKADSIYDRRQAQESTRPIFDWFLIVLVCCIPLDIAVRRIQLDWMVIKSWFGFGPKLQTSTATMGTLLNRKENVQKRMQTQRQERPSHLSDLTQSRIKPSGAGSKSTTLKSSGSTKPTEKKSESKSEPTDTTMGKLLEMKRKRNQDSD